MRLILTIIFLLTACAAEAATYYIDYATGADSNNGTAKVSPWKRAPGMKGFTGTYSHTAGDRFIFKGGVTWPSSCYQWQITAGGSGESVRDYYGVDLTWYAGAAYTRPLIDFEHVVINGWTAGAGILVQGCSYVMFDGLDIARHRTPLAKDGIGTWGTASICYDNSGYNILTNCVIRDWDHPVPIDAGTSGGGGVIRVNTGNYNVVTHCEFHQEGVAVKTGTCCWNIYQVDNTEFHHTPTAIMSSTVAFRNYIHHLANPTDVLAHSNVMLCNGGFTAYDNLIHDIPNVAQVIFIAPGYYGPHTARIHNNVVYNVAQPCIAIDTDGLNDPGGVAQIWNNTLVGPGGSGNCIRVGFRNNGPLGALDYANNHLVSSSPVWLEAPITSLTTRSNLIQTLPQANGYGYMTTNAFAPADATKPTVDRGIDLSAVFNTDRIGVTRSVPWDVGAYEWSGAPAPQPGTIVLSTATQSVSEEAGTVNVTIHRTGGTSGTVGVIYGTADGTAAAGVNYTTKAGSLTWSDGDATDRVISVTVLDANVYGNQTFTLALSSPTGGAALGNPSTGTITLLGSGQAPVVIQPGLGPWAAINGEIAPPFSSNGGYVSQPMQTTLEDGGLAVFRFVAPSTGQYRCRALTRAEDGAYNSFFVAMNDETPDTWHVVDLTSGFEWRYVGLQGTGDYQAPQFPTAVWALTGGTTNTFTVIGREALTAIQEVEIELINPPPDPVPVVSVTCTNVNGYYGPGDTLGFVVTFAEPVTVSEGTPSLALDFGGSASYVSGSGTAELLFQCDPIDGDSSAVDYAATNSLSGAIVVDATPADLTLPVPGQPGSASYGRSIVWDSTPPTVEISAPSLTVTRTAEVHYLITFADTYFGSADMNADDVTLHTTDTASATVLVSGTSDQVQTVTLRDITGEGTLSISIASGLASDLAGNTAPEAGPSSPVTVRSQMVIHIQGINTPVLLVE